MADAREGSSRVGGHAADDHVLRLVLAADRSEEGLRADLAGLDGRDALLGSGQLMVDPLRSLHDLDAPERRASLGRTTKRAGRPFALRGSTPSVRRLWALLGLPGEPQVRWT